MIELEGGSAGDTLQKIDESVGPQIERVVREWVPQDLSRGIRRRVVRYIGEQVGVVQPQSDDQSDEERCCSGEVISPTLFLVSPDGHLLSVEESTQQIAQWNSGSWISNMTGSFEE